jgi:hypothetical protein
MMLGVTGKIESIDRVGSRDLRLRSRGVVEKKSPGVKARAPSATLLFGVTSLGYSPFELTFHILINM